MLKFAVTTRIGLIFLVERACMKEDDALLNTQVSVTTLIGMIGG